VMFYGATRFDLIKIFSESLATRGSQKKSCPNPIA